MHTHPYNTLMETIAVFALEDFISNSDFPKGHYTVNQMSP